MVVVARPSSTKATEPSSRIFTDPVYVCEDNTLGPQFNLDDFDWHYVYVCTKVLKDVHSTNYYDHFELNNQSYKHRIKNLKYIYI
jgi:hypothetical protein